MSAAPRAQRAGFLETEGIVIMVQSAHMSFIPPPLSARDLFMEGIAAET